MGFLGLAIFIVLPLLEIALFVYLGGAIGLGWTLFTILLTGIIGMRLIRNQGFAVLGQLQSQVSAGQAPMGQIAHGVLIVIAGMLLVTPGFFTDAVGFFLLWPAGRNLVLEFVLSLVIGIATQRAGQMGMPPGQAADKQQNKDGRRPIDDNTIDGEFTAHTDDR